MAAAFNESYRGSPPWDIGHPQAEFVRLAKEGEIKGKILDVGCGTGENAMLFAGLGLEVWGVDAAPLAIEKAKRKAADRGAKATFDVRDALRLKEIPTKFDTITDSGLFHIFPDRQRVIFAQSLHWALNTGGTYFMLCFSDKEPTGWGGPRRVSKEEIRTTFKEGWRVDWIRAARLETKFHDGGGRAWLSSITSV
jgi:SAM-dependent methyltransferase